MTDIKDPFANLDSAPPRFGAPGRGVPVAPATVPPAPAKAPQANVDDLSKFDWSPAADPEPATPEPVKTAPSAPAPQTDPAPAAGPRRPGGPVLQDMAAGGRGFRTQKKSNDDQLHLDDLLRKLVEEGSSDLHLTANMEPMMRKHGEIQPLPGFRVLSPSQIQELLFAIMTDQQKTEYQQKNDLDMAHEIPGVSRFRVNVLKQRRMAGSVIRVIPNEIKTLEALGMPDHLKKLADLPRGLVLVTGPTGSGKSTTLASIIDSANKRRRDHIITIEGPIEFVHQNQNCIITQREVGVDTASFAEGLKRALREDPDIILVGEMRDRETIETAITAAETGHLVFGTLHTQSASETMNRIIDAFPGDAKDQIRAQLAASLQGIVSQTLMKRLGGKGRVAALEILYGEPSIRNMIRVGKTDQIGSTLEINKKKNMQTLGMHLAELVQANKVAVDDAIMKASSRDNLVLKLGGEAELEKIRRIQHSLIGNNPYKN